MSKTINTYKEMFWKDRPYLSFPWIAEKEFITSFIQNIQQNFWQNAHILEIWSFYGDDTKVFAEKGLNILATDAVKELLNHIENNIINNNIKTAYFDAKNPEGLYKLISDNNISGVFAKQVLQHLSKLEFMDLLFYLYNALPVWGTFWFTLELPSLERDIPLVNRLKYNLNLNNNKKTYYGKDIWMIRVANFHDPKWTINWLKNNGWDIIKNDTVDFKPELWGDLQQIIIIKKKYEQWFKSYQIFKDSFDYIKGSSIAALLTILMSTGTQLQINNIKKDTDIIKLSSLSESDKKIEYKKIEDKYATYFWIGNMP